MTSSISFGSRPGARRMASLTTVAPMSSGRCWLNFPAGALPMAVRAAETMTASFIGKLLERDRQRLQTTECRILLPLQRIGFQAQVRHAIQQRRQRGFPFQPRERCAEAKVRAHAKAE